MSTPLLYFISSDFSEFTRDRFIKVGNTKQELKDRLSPLQTGSAMQHKVIGTWVLKSKDSAELIEEVVLERLSRWKCRERCEWLRFPHDDGSYFTAFISTLKRIQNEYSSLFATKVSDIESYSPLKQAPRKNKRKSPKRTGQTKVFGGRASIFYRGNSWYVQWYTRKEKTRIKSCQTKDKSEGIVRARAILEREGFL